MLIKEATYFNQENFTKEQKNIFEFIRNGKGHGIIDAVAGSGKTTTILECAKYVEDKADILFCAFNKSIQSEIAENFNRQGLNQVTVKTIHALGLQILNDNNNTGKEFELQESKYRNIFDTDFNMQNKYVEELLKINLVEFKSSKAEEIRQYAKNVFHQFKERLLDINQKYRATLTQNSFDKFKVLIEHFSFFTETKTKSKFFIRELEIYFECNNILLEKGNSIAKITRVIDYTDMIYLPYIWDLRALKTYSFLFIDECQDLSQAQIAVVLKYGKQDGRILAVGDPYQSIYGFAGADIESFSRIKNITKAKQFPLTACFRCPPNVVKLAASVRKDISVSKREEGKIEEIGFSQVAETAQINDLVISRLKEPILSLVFEFIDKNIRVQIHREDVNNIIDELKRLFKQEERTVIIEKVQGNIEKIKETVNKRWRFLIEQEAKKLENPNDRSVYIQTETTYLNEKLEFISKKYTQWKSTCQTINDILLKIKDFISATDNCVKLSTIHRAKGLEAKRVFILNYNDLPHTMPNQKSWEMIQERNLKYVAITRALNELYLVQSKKISTIKQDATLFDTLAINS